MLQYDWQAIHPPYGGRTVRLDDVETDVSAQLDEQSRLGVQVTQKDDVPDSGPTNGGIWYQIREVSAVFADLKQSTKLSAENRPKAAARAYTYFIRAMAVILDRFDAKYVDIQGDGVFGLFSGKDSRFLAAACAITMRTKVEREVAVRFEKETSTDWKLTAGVGIDNGTLLVRRLGLRGTKQNEVWAGKPVNMASKLSSLAGPNQVIVSDRVFKQYEGASKLRRRSLLWTCGCDGCIEGSGLDAPAGETTYLWEEETVSEDVGLDFENFHRLKSKWCETHGSEFCEAIITGKRPDA